MVRYVFLLFFHTLFASKYERKMELCAQLKCDDLKKKLVCGLRAEEEGLRLKLFKNECELIKYGCNVNEKIAYRLINLEYCQTSNETTHNKNVRTIYNTFFKQDLLVNCDLNCDDVKTNEICAIRGDGDGFRIKLFKNGCEIIKYNCINNLQYNVTDSYVCKESLIRQNIDFYNNDNTEKPRTIEDEINEELNRTKINSFNLTRTNGTKNIVVVNSRMFDDVKDINSTIDTFFAASHVFDLPMKEINVDTRRKYIKHLGPLKVFVPWIVIPENISSDLYHTPTLSSCYHKCPTKCPDTYAPVCGVPGIVAREPSLMFQNHCFMDVAQCKMYWEEKSSTAHSSSYVETSFLFCMGDEMNAMYRFLPAIRTLQRMGRLKKKGKFRAKLKNFRFLNDFRSGNPKFMG